MGVNGKEESLTSRGLHGTIQQVCLTCLAKHEVQNRCAGAINTRSSLILLGFEGEVTPSILRGIHCLDLRKQGGQGGRD